jgi:hypothetical protein
MIDQLAQGAQALHGQLEAVYFIDGNKNCILQFADGTLLHPRRWSQNVPHARKEIYALKIAQAMHGQDPYSLLAFGYDGTGSSAFATFLRECGFAQFHVADIVPPVKLDRAGNRITGTVNGDHVEWNDGTTSPTSIDLVTQSQ